MTVVGESVREIVGFCLCTATATATRARPIFSPYFTATCLRARGDPYLSSDGIVASVSCYSQALNKSLFMSGCGVSTVPHSCSNFPVLKCTNSMTEIMKDKVKYILFSKRRNAGAEIDPRKLIFFL